MPQHQGSHQFEAFSSLSTSDSQRTPARIRTNERMGWVSNMQTKNRSEHSKAKQGKAKHQDCLHTKFSSCALDRAQSCDKNKSRHTTPHHTTPHRHDTTPRNAAERTRRRGRRVCLPSCLIVCGTAAPSTPRNSLEARFSVTPYASLVLSGVLVVVWLQAMVWSSIRSQPSGRQPSPTMHVLVPRLCTSTVCRRMHSSPVPALVSGDRFS